MVTKKKAMTERATVSRERRLALALRGLMDGMADGETDNALKDATSILDEFGYSQLEGTQRRLARINGELAAAIAAGNGKEIARLGLELERAKAGKSEKVVEAAE